jgi:hypothetical protein
MTEAKWQKQNDSLENERSKMTVYKIIEAK